MVYCFTVNNLEEEIQVLDFLGLDPPGKPIDEYLSELTKEELTEWKNYWVSMWDSLGRTDITKFVNKMYNKYLIKQYLPYIIGGGALLLLIILRE